jgi:hypothetical protein
MIAAIGRACAASKLGELYLLQPVKTITPDVSQELPY